MQLKSTLHYLAYFYTFLILSFPAICLYFISKVMDFIQGNWSLGVIVFVVFMAIIALIVFIWGFFVEMNLRMAQVRLTDERVIIQQLLGFGTKRTYEYAAIDGFVVKKFQTRGKEQEYLYLIQDHKAIGVFSSLYFKNYLEIKNTLKCHLKEYQT